MFDSDASVVRFLDHCSKRYARFPGSLSGRIIGRALDENGDPIATVERQEHYVEATFAIQEGVQDRFARALSKSGSGEELATWFA